MRCSLMRRSAGTDPHPGRPDSTDPRSGLQPLHMAAGWTAHTATEPKLRAGARPEYRGTRSQSTGRTRPQTMPRPHCVEGREASCARRGYPRARRASHARPRRGRSLLFREISLSRGRIGHVGTGASAPAVHPRPRQGAGRGQQRDDRGGAAPLGGNAPTRTSSARESEKGATRPRGAAPAQCLKL